LSYYRGKSSEPDFTMIGYYYGYRGILLLFLQNHMASPAANFPKVVFKNLNHLRG